MTDIIMDTLTEEQKDCLWRSGLLWQHEEDTSKENRKAMDEAIVELRNASGHLHKAQESIDDAVSACEETLSREGGKTFHDGIYNKYKTRDKPPKFIWVASPYADDPAKRVTAIRDWCSGVFSALNPNTILPIPVVARTGDWGSEVWDEYEWYRTLCWDLRIRHWDAFISVERLLGEDDDAHKRSKGVAMEKQIAEKRGLPILEVDAEKSIFENRTAIANWLDGLWAPPCNPKEGWFSDVE